MCQKFKIKEKTKERTVWQEQGKSLIGGGEKRNGKLVGVAETGGACSVAQAFAEELEQTGPAAKKE